MLPSFLHKQSGGGADLEEDHDLHVQLAVARAFLFLVYLAAIAWQLDGE